MLIQGRELSAYSQSVQITFIDIPKTPSITVTPMLPVYLVGESLNITCSLPKKSTVISIQYFIDNHEIYKPKEPKTMSSYVIPKLSLENKGSYTCQYWLNYSGRHISSHSSPFLITVEETPYPPSIDLSPVLPVYTSGESISIKCVPPNGFDVLHIQYFKDDKEFHKSLENSYVISSLSHAERGTYSCGYMSNRYGRQIFSKKSQSISITVVDIPQAPSIILNPKEPVYIKGENVSLTCSLPEDSTVTTIQFFKGDQEIHISEMPTIMSSYNISNLSQWHAGSYKCQYWVITSGRNILSHASLPVSITVEDPSSTPFLRLTPNMEIYVVGETLVLTCYGFGNVRYHIYKDGQLLKNDLSYQIPSLQLYHNGNYTCNYTYAIKERQIKSPESSTVNIHVIDPWPAPTLTLEGSIVKVEAGFRVTLNCSAPDDDLLRTFYYFNPVKENDVTNLTASSASLEFNLGQINHISYVCEYEQELRGRKIRSKRSQVLSLQLSEASMMSPPVIAGIIGAICLLLCFTLALWFYMKSKKYKRFNRFSFSWYWKENRRANKTSPRSSSPVKKNEETSQVLDTTEEGRYKIASRSPSRLSITTQKEVDPEDKAVNFSTFYCENLSGKESAWDSSIL